MENKIEELRSEQRNLSPADARYWEIDDEINELHHRMMAAEPKDEGPTDAQLAAMDWVMSDNYDN